MALLSCSRSAAIERSSFMGINKKKFWSIGLALGISLIPMTAAGDQTPLYSDIGLSDLSNLIYGFQATQSGTGSSATAQISGTLSKACYDKGILVSNSS